MISYDFLMVSYRCSAHNVIVDIRKPCREGERDLSPVSRKALFRGQALFRFAPPRFMGSFLKGFLCGVLKLLSRL